MKGVGKENTLSDEQLYINFLHSDNEALDELLVRHKEGLTWFLYGIVKNLEDAEDLMMDTFALLITKRVNFRNDSSFKTWLYGIGRNLSKKHIRKKAYANEGDMKRIKDDLLYPAVLEAKTNYSFLIW